VESPPPSLDHDEPEPRHRIDIHVPTATIAKLLAAAAVVWVALRIWPEILLLCFSMLFAIALAPAISAGERRGIPRWCAVVLLACAGLAVASVFAVFVLPPLVTQISDLVADLPGLHARLVDRLHPSRAFARLLDRIFELPQSPEVAALVRHPLAIGMSAVSGATSTVVVLAMTLYFLVDGKRLYAWLLAYVPRAHRAKMAITAPALSQVVSSFVRGQAIVSLLFAFYVSIITSALAVPAVLPIAVLAFVCDVIPVVGIFLATVPTALLALADSPVKALAVAASFLGYHLFETYVIIPRVYGSRMRLSTLTVLLALVIGASLQGIVGAILALPVVAAYPIIERIWLRGYLSDDVLRDHEALDRARGSLADHVVDAVILGEVMRAERPRSFYYASSRRRFGRRLRRKRNGGPARPMR
jgi:predicted PurR-regulated permease PerM